MSHVYQDENITVVKRHKIIFFLKNLKNILFIILSFAGAMVIVNFDWETNSLPIKYILFTAIFIIFNYAFINLVLNIIKYYNYLILIYGDYIIFIKASLFLRDDIQILNSGKITKVYQETHGLFPNMFKYGDLIIEQQSDDVKVINYVPNPSGIINIINSQLMDRDGKKK